MRISYHAKKRIVQRDENSRNHEDAKRLAKTAFNSGDTINSYQKYPKFFDYLKRRIDESNTCTIRIYRGNIYIWKGKSKTLITCHEIPARFIKEMEEVNNG